MWDPREDSYIQELAARIEALEEGSIEQAESNRFCTDAIVARIEALEAAQQPDQIAPEPEWQRLSVREPQDGDRCAYRVAPRFTKELGTWSSVVRRFWTSNKGLFYGEPDLISWRLARPHELFPDQPAPATEESSATAAPAPDDRLRWCPSHGQQPRNAWGCPESVREPRAAATLLQQLEAQYGVQRRYPSPATIAECGGPCDSQGHEACDCGLLQELNPPSPAPAGGLVERVAEAIEDAPHPLGDWRPEARAAIREVAKWLRSDGPDRPSVASLLEQEVNQ
jgi:hypothetical protein